MHTIAISMPKGGTGKTTTVVALARCLGRRGLRVLVVDLDQQGHATALLAGVRAPQAGSRELLLEGAELEDVVIECEDNVSVCGAWPGLAQVEIALAGEVARESFLRDGLQNATQWDVALLDCPPSLGILTVNALVAADFVLSPLRPAFLPLLSVRQLDQTLAKITSRLNPNLHQLGYVLCAVDKRKRVTKEAREMLSEHAPDDMLLHEIRVDTAFETPEAGRGGRGMRDYVALGQLIMERLQLKAPQTVAA